MPASVGQGVGPGRVVALQQLLDPARPESRHLRRRSDRMALRQQPDHLHVTGLDRIRAGPETSLQFQNIQVIRDAPHGRALQQDLKPNPISARRESAPNESMSRTPYDIPERYGPATTCANRFRRWQKVGVWNRIFKAVTQGYDGDLQMIDSSSIRVHQHGGNVKKGGLAPRRPPLGTTLEPSAWGARGAA